MNIRKILKELEKEKDKLSYLKKLLEKIKDKKLKSQIQQLIDYLEKNTTGILSDITPTILELLELPEPPEMTGKSLIKLLR